MVPGGAWMRVNRVHVLLMERSNNKNGDTFRKELSGADGIFLVTFKRYGETWVPLGCLHDLGERIDALRLRMSDSIMPLLYRIKDHILNEYPLEVNNLRFGASIFGKWFAPISLDTLQEITDSKLGRQGDEDFEIRFWIDCYENNNGALIHWGATISILYGEEPWYDEELETNYPIWFLYIENKFTPIEIPLSDEKMRVIIHKAMRELKMDLDHASIINPVIAWNIALNIAHHILNIPEDNLMVYDEKPAGFSVSGLNIRQPSWFIYGPMVGAWDFRYNYSQECQVVVISMSTGKILYTGLNNGDLE